MTQPELSIIIPTFNERENLSELVNKLAKALERTHWEVVFVDDDSPDGTLSIIRQLAADNSRVRCVHRIKRRGLSSAFIEGSLVTTSPFIALMDGDLQHDETILPQMLEAVKNESYDMAVGSRYIDSGGVDNWDASRVKVSRFATTLSRHLLKIELSDPMSGFFLLRRDTFDKVVRKLSGIGYKVLLDIFSSSEEPLKVKEVPYQFRNRKHGESKLDAHIVWDFLMLIGDKFFGSVIPIRFISFSLIGTLGVIFHMLILSTFMQVLGIGFIASQSIAIFTTIYANFTLNNLLTYHDKRLKGWNWIKGLTSFYFVCSLGAFSNIAISTYLYQMDVYWFLAALAGIAVGAIWNYTLSSLYTWD